MPDRTQGVLLGKCVLKKEGRERERKGRVRGEGRGKKAGIDGREKGKK